MELLTDIRYWLGVVVLSSWVPAIFCWVLIHPLVKFWRQTGKAAMWLVVSPIALAGVAILFYFRDSLMGEDLGTNFWLWIPAFILTVLGTYLDFARRKYLTTRILVGTPEIEGDASNLLTEGLYAHVRHPRYVAITASYLGFSLFANFAGVYIYLLASAPLLWLIIVLEEKELRNRFGKAYEDYAKKTPRLIPKLSRKP